MLRWIGAELLVVDRHWRSYQTELEEEKPALQRLRLAVRQSHLVQDVYRRALKSMLLGLLEKDFLQQASRQEDAGQVVPYEDLLYLIPETRLSQQVLEELDGMAED